MLGVLSRFFERRRRSFMMLVTTVGGGYLLMSYIKSKLNEMQEALTRNRITTDKYVTPEEVPFREMNISLVSPS